MFTRQESITIEDVDEVIRDEVIRNHQPNQSTEACSAKLQSTFPTTVILEQPASRSVRFRYECEGRSAGSIPGIRSTASSKTYPTIQIQNYSGPAVVVVSCVTKDPPFRPHPNNLVGKEGCKQGVCTVIVNNPDMTYSFTSLGIQCVKKKNVDESLRKREALKVDPFNTGFSHASLASEIDLNAVRLCFQVFIKGPDGKYTVALSPVVSDVIHDKKAMSDLSIYKLSHCSAPVSGGTEVIMLCDKILKNDIQVRFFEEKNGDLVWEGYADFQPCDVYRMVAVCFRTPRYCDQSVKYPVSVNVQLVRPSDNERSQPRPFQFLPLEPDPDGLIRKRLKVEAGCLDRFYISTEKAGTEEVVENKPVVVPRMMKHAVRGSSRTKSCTDITETEAIECSSTAGLLELSSPSSICAAAGSSDAFSRINMPMASATDPLKDQPLIVGSTQDFLAIATQCLGELPVTIDPIASTEGYIDEATEKIDSIDLSLDPEEFLNLQGCLAEGLPMNLSESLFESGNHLDVQLDDIGHVETEQKNVIN